MNKKKDLIYLMEDGSQITADSIPDLDEWGWDSWWNCAQWVAWHKANKAKYGKAIADQKFTEYWNQQSWGAGALDCRSFNSDFRKYIERNNLEDAVWEGAGVFKHILKPVGAGGEVITGTTRGITTVGRAIPWIVGGLLVGGAIYGGVKLYKELKK